MYKIGEFSRLSKTTIKTLRYYEDKELLSPSFVDPETGYRYYDSKQLRDISEILSLKQLGISIKNIKEILGGGDLGAILQKRKREIEKGQELYYMQLSKINYLLEGKNMSNEIFMKELPRCTVYYKEGLIEDYSHISEFILDSGRECLNLNPNIKCVTPDYCFVEYLDGEYKEKNIKIRYSQAVETSGIGNDNIKFKDLESVNAICIYHKGAYEELGKSYSAIMNYIETNGYKITGFFRECYIDGVWNKKNVDEWLTEIQVPVEKLV